MNKWVLIGGGLVMGVLGVPYGQDMSAMTVTGLSLMWVGLAMTGE